MAGSFSLPQKALLSLRALAVLALARAALHRIGPTGVVDRNARAARMARAIPPAVVREQCDRVAFFILRIARRVPWRSDCLVQALAGQQWLQAEGIASEIVVGTAKAPGGSFESHAWLRHHERILLGGDISRFAPLLEPDPAVLDRR